jgi:hypothetical protein
LVRPDHSSRVATAASKTDGVVRELRDIDDLHGDRPRLKFRGSRPVPCARLLQVSDLGASGNSCLTNFLRRPRASTSWRHGSASSPREVSTVRFISPDRSYGIGLKRAEMHGRPAVTCFRVHRPYRGPQPKFHVRRAGNDGCRIRIALLAVNNADVPNTTYDLSIRGSSRPSAAR